MDDTNLFKRLAIIYTFIYTNKYLTQPHKIQAICKHIKWYLSCFFIVHEVVIWACFAHVCYDFLWFICLMHFVYFISP